jgi:hypothetical protein
MSVKIYNGWRWKKSLGFFEMIEKIKAAAHSEFSRQIKEAVVSMELDRPKTKKARYELATFIARLINRSAYASDAAYDYNRVYYIKDAGDYYLMMPSNTRLKHAALYQVNGLEDFKYWDNVDTPEEITQEDWKARGAFWDKNWGEKAACATFELVDPIFPMTYVTDVVVPDMFEKKEVDDSYWDEGRKNAP